VDHPDVEQMSSEQVNQFRKEKQIYVKGELVAKPILGFEHLLDKVVDNRIISKLRSQYGIADPTPIQS